LVAESLHCQRPGGIPLHRWECTALIPLGRWELYTLSSREESLLAAESINSQWWRRIPSGANSQPPWGVLRIDSQKPLGFFIFFGRIDSQTCWRFGRSNSNLWGRMVCTQGVLAMSQKFSSWNSNFWESFNWDGRWTKSEIPTVYALRGSEFAVKWQIGIRFSLCSLPDNVVSSVGP
jgi:hypothetical protein